MSSNWAGDDNPSHLRMMRRWAEIEEEFGEPIAEVISSLREVGGGNSWHIVAGCLGVTLKTLRNWRTKLGMDINRSDQKTDPSSYDLGKHPAHFDFRARELGYESAQEAVLELRLTRKKTCREAADVLGCCEGTVRKYTPNRLRGMVYNRSPRWWESQREKQKRMVEMAKQKRETSSHPWDRRWDNGGCA